MPAPPNGRALLLDPSSAGGLLGWWSARSPEGLISTGATGARDLSGNNRSMVPITAGAAAGYLGWGPDGIVNGGLAFSQDLATTSSDGLTAVIPSTSAPFSFYLVAWAAVGTSSAEIFGLNNNGSGVGNQGRILLSSTTWTARLSSSQSISASNIALGVAHLVYLAQDVSGNVCSLYIDDPITAKASVTVTSTPTGMTNAILLNNNSGSSTTKGGRVADVVLYSGSPHDAGTRYKTFRWLASLNKLPFSSRIFGN